MAGAHEIIGAGGPVQLGPGPITRAKFFEGTDQATNVVG